MTRSIGTLVGSLALVVALAGPVRAQNTLYYVDFLNGTDHFLTALGDVGATTTVAADPTDFATQLAGGGFDLAVFFQQDSSGPGYDAAFAALETFIDAGGAAIATDWKLPDGSLHGDPFDAGFATLVNYDELTVTDPDLAAGLVNPVVLTNPGWGVYSVGLTGTMGANEPTGEGAIVIGNGGRTLFNGFLSDTIEDPVTAVTLFQNEIRYVTGERAPVPEPGALTALAALGVSGLGFMWRRRRA